MKAPKREINYALALWRRRWWIIPCILLGLAGAVAAFLQMTPVYQSQAVVILIPQTISQSIYETRWIPPTLRLKIIEQEVQSTALLEQVAAELGMKNMSPQELKRLGGRVQITQVDPSTYTFRTMGTDPRAIAKRANAFAQVFVRRSRESKVENTDTSLQFLRDDIARMEQELREAKQELADFQAEYKGELPSDRERHRQEQIFLRNRMAELEARIMTRKKDRQERLDMLNEPNADTGSLSGDGPLEDPRLQLARRLRRDLEEARLRYTERHPEVVRLKARLEALNKDLMENPDPAPLTYEDPDAPRDGASPEATRRADAFRRYIQLEIDRLSDEIAELEAQRGQAASQVENLEELIQASYNRGRIMDQMIAGINGLEDRLVRQQGELQDLETEKQVFEREMDERYEVKSAAGVPLLPFKPDLLQLLFMGFVVGAGAGAGLALLREFLDRSVWSTEEVEELLGAQVLAVIPDMDKTKGSAPRRPGRRSRRRAHG